MIDAISFYQISEALYNVTLPRIITKIFEEERKVNLLCSDKEEMKRLDSLLWTFAQLSFLPHATEEDEYQDTQDLLLITKLPSANLSNKTLILTSGELLLKQDINNIHTHKKLFIVTDKIIDRLGLIETLAFSGQQVQIKHFSQNPDGSWKDHQKD